MSSDAPSNSSVSGSNSEESLGSGLSRRSFFGSVGAGALGVAALGAAGLSTSCGNARGNSSLSALRTEQSLILRRRVADLAFVRGSEVQTPNSDENNLPNFIGSFSKTLQHNAIGEVDAAAYNTYRRSLDNLDFARIDSLMIGPRKLANPQAGIAFALAGADSSVFAMPAAPTFSSAEEAGEIVELYWMALLRDVNFSDYETNADVQAAVADLNAMSDFRGPRVSGAVTPRTLFRSPTPGDLAGPYISQLLFADVPLGTLSYEQRQRTYPANSDQMTSFGEWLSIQNGNAPSSAQPFESTRRYIRNMRDLASYVRDDVLFQAYWNAALILLGRGVPLSAGFRSAYSGSTSQAGFATFGGPHILELMTSVSIQALRAVWFQKWFVHRRLRPEAFAGHIQVHRSGQATYPIHGDVLNSAAVARVESRFGNALLPMAYVEGSPTHPAYGAGHNIVASACVSVLKACFDTSAPFTNPVVPNADGTALIPYTGPDAGSLTVGGELDKLVGNISQGRNGAGVHWRSDYTGSIPMGEKVAETLILEQQYCLNERATFRYTRADGSEAVIGPV